MIQRKPIPTTATKPNASPAPVDCNDGGATNETADTENYSQHFDSTNYAAAGPNDSNITITQETHGTSETPFSWGPRAMYQVVPSQPTTSHKEGLRARELKPLSIGGQDLTRSNGADLERFTKPPQALPRYIGAAPIAQPMKRYWLRGLAALLGPPGLTGYFIAIWRHWILQSSNTDDQPLPQGPAGALLVYYGWFIVGVIALNLTKYGLVGVEGGMLMDPRWGARNAMEIMMHCDKNWGGPSGWGKVLVKCLWKAENRLRPSHSWVVLSLISMLGFIMLPLSGLSMELGDGWRPAALGQEPAEVVGRDPQSIYNSSVNSFDVTSAAYSRWKQAVEPSLPRRSAYYVASNSVPNAPEWLKTFPNRWPDNATMDIFVTPQTDVPVTGGTWGIRANYSCNIVRHIDEFKFLSQRDNKTKALTAGEGMLFAPVPLTAEETVDFNPWVVNQTISLFHNLEGVMEIAMSTRPPVAEKFLSSESLQVRLNDDVPGHLEVALWQSMHRDEEIMRPGSPFELVSDALEDTITGEGIENFQDAWRRKPLLNQNGSKLWRTPSKVIGLKCSTFFQAGFAIVDGLKGTFDADQWRKDDRIFWNNYSQNPVGFPFAIPQILTGQVAGAPGWGTMDAQTSWIAWENSPVQGDPENSVFLPALFRSAEALNISRYSQEYDVQLDFLTAEELLVSVIRAFKAYSITLMDTPTKVPRQLMNVNVTNAEPLKILVPGAIDPRTIAILMCIWSVISIWLALQFAFRPRWTDDLDGYSMFRFGADYAGISAHVSLDGYETCKDLLRIPGLVGDARPTTDPGRISLVPATAPADTSKKYL